MSNQWESESSEQQPGPDQQPQQLPSLPNQQPWPPENPYEVGFSAWNQSTIPNQQPPSNRQPWHPQSVLNPRQLQSPPSQPKKKKKLVWIILGIIVGILMLCGACGILGAISSKDSNTSNVVPTTTTAPSTKVTQSTQASVQPTATPTQVPTPTATPTPLPTPTPTATPTPPPTPTPTETAAQIEADYKAGTTSTTVTNLDKDGSADQGENVDFTCTIVSFVKDSTGTTAGANVTDAGSYSGSFVQIVFPAGTDITQLNQQDTVAVWGLDMGTLSGTNAFGATVQEVGVTALYMNDQTTNYQAGD